MNARANIKDFLPLFLNNVPMMDVRAPVEFIKGAFPSSQNIPLLDDLQRQEIGTQYKKKGQDQAIKLGNELATPHIRAQRLAAWQAFTQAHPEGVLYCFRGGLRSKVTQQWLQENGIDYPFVEGGYKAMRTFLIEQLQVSLETMPLVLVSGRTASGKTHFLHELSRHIDLEGRANHRGSSFGAMVTPQPSQIDFENSLSIDLLKQRHAHQRPVFMEDEGRLIGQLALPHEMLKAMTEQYPLVVLQTPMAERIAIAVQDYITDLYPQYQARHGEHAHEIFSEKILFNLSRIKKRLGGEQHKSLHGQLSEALQALAQGDEDGFAQPIGTLLEKYYDPMYDYQLSKRQGRILLQAPKEELLAWCEHYQPARDL
ncbi:MAG: tRNA 2-selenouridine(34) synthase MnmH [Bermanella sp.]